MLQIYNVTFYNLQDIVVTSSKNVKLQPSAGHPFEPLCIFEKFSDTGVTVAASLTLKQQPVIRDRIIGEVNKFINLIDL